ncbi:MAG: hypothetical protein K1X85_06275 [Ignavibacteria bacterium]|nr:hypothetical protein [Ignavibacteria bacterium]
MDVAFNSKRESLLRLSRRCGQKFESYSKKSNRYSAARLISFIALSAAVIYLFSISTFAGWASLAVSLAVFSLIVHFHNKLLSGMRRIRVYSSIMNEDIARMDIEWEKLPGFYSADADELDFIERDLDLYGHRSLHCLLDNTVSVEGSELLRKFIHGDFPGYDELQDRQNIVRELSSYTRLRRRFQLRARLSSPKKINCEATVRVFNTDLSYKAPIAAVFLSFAFSVAFIAASTLTAAGLYEGPSALFLILNLFTYFAFAGKTGKALSALSEIEPEISKFHSVVRTLANSRLPENSAARIRFADFFGPSGLLQKEMNSLRKLSDASAYRENAVFRLLINLIVPYDFVLQRKFRDSALRVKEHIGGWLEKFNELECFFALANFAELNPDYQYAGMSEDRKFSIQNAGHPLMKREHRKLNDFEMKKENELVIITGSNMSGKSTFLRTAGINLCLAYSGAPSACTALHASGYELFTCIKVSDSVFDGISYFYSEVKRLKMLLDILEDPGRGNVMFFIDEIFKGTNNKERLHGSMEFLKKLSTLKCTGFVTTHDLELAALSDSLDAAVNYHFREHIEGGRMSFEYKILPDPCPTTNALEIMRMNGLPV